MNNLENIINKINSQNGVKISRPQDPEKVLRTFRQKDKTSSFNSDPGIELFTQVQKFPRQVNLNLGNSTKTTLELNQCIPVGKSCESCGDYLNQSTIGVANQSFSTTRPEDIIEKRNFCESVKSCNDGKIVNNKNI